MLAVPIEEKIAAIEITNFDTVVVRTVSYKRPLYVSVDQTEVV